MSADVRHRPESAAGGFTLLEILTATVMFSIIIGALYSVFYGAIRMREKAYKNFEMELPRAYVASLIRKDLMSLLPSSGLFSGPLIGEDEEENGYRRDTIQFYTASGIVKNASPWGDVRQVMYSLAPPTGTEENKEGTSSLAATDLIRTVTDNLLQSEEEDPRVERLLHGVQSLEITYYDGEYWEDSWDGSTETDTSVEAISMLISFDPQSATDTVLASPIRLVVPVTIESASSESSSSSSSQSSSGSTTGGGTSGGGGSGGGGGSSGGGMR